MVKKRVTGFFALLAVFGAVLFMMQGMYFNHISGNVISSKISSEESKYFSFDVQNWELNSDGVRVYIFVRDYSGVDENMVLHYNFVSSNGEIIQRGTKNLFLSANGTGQYIVQIPFRNLNSGIYDLVMFLENGKNTRDASIRGLGISRDKFQSKVTGAVIGGSDNLSSNIVTGFLVLLLIGAIYSAYGYRKSLRKISSKSEDRFIKLEV